MSPIIVQNMALRDSPVDSYVFTQNKPVRYRNLRDDVNEIIAHCIEYGYNYYLYGGMVMQLEPSQFRYDGYRWFVSFNLLNSGWQAFYEASGNGHVLNIQRDPDALQAFYEELKRGS